MTKIIAHRGSKGTHPENTLAAFKEAVLVGADGIELDVQCTKDNKLVVIHDNTVNRTTNGKGEITDFKLKQLKKLDAGSWFSPEFKGEKIPTLEEVLACLQEASYTGVLNIEIKTDEKEYPGIEEAVMNVMNSQEWTFSYWYSSFNFQSLERIQELDKETPKAYIMSTEKDKISLSNHVDYIEAIHPRITFVTAREETSSYTTKKVRPWTVNKVEQMIGAFERGLDGIHTDFPRKALAVRAIFEALNEEE